MTEPAIDHEGLKLKVMRLYKPALHVERGGEVVSDLLRLPDSFGSIFVGQSFSSYISVTNGGPSSVRSVALTAELQTGKKRFTLVDRRRECGGALGPGVPKPCDNPQLDFESGASLDVVVQRQLAELGMHVLRVSVEYEARRTGEKRSFKKFYRFNVLRPFSLTTRIASLPCAHSDPTRAAALSLATEVCVD